MLDLDPSSVFINLVIGAVGFALFVYGKKAERWPHLGAGILLMAYPYFVDGALSLFLVGAGILVGLAAALYLGY